MRLYWSARIALFGACALGEVVLLALWSSPLPPHAPVPIATAFDGDRAYAAVRELVERFPRRTTGSEADAAAAAWMAERFAALGLAVEEQRFQAWGSWGREPPALHDGRNVVAVSPGAERRAVVIGAHRDVVPETIEGAEDNGSGSGALLELARVLAASPHRLSYVFVSFGAEEIGLGGSRHYLARATLPTALAISVDTVGQADGARLMLADAWSLPAGAAWDLGHRARADGLVDRPPAREPLALTRLQTLVDPGVTDSLPFALRGQPAVGLGWIDPPYREIHTAADTLDRVSPSSLARVGRLTESFVRALDAEPALLASRADYLLYADGRFVAPPRVWLASSLLGAFAVGQVLLAALAARRCVRAAPAAERTPGGQLAAERRFALAAVASAALGGLVPLVHPADQAPGPWELLLWIAWWTLLVALPGTVRRRGLPPTVAVRRLELVAACALSYLGFGVLVSPFFALLAAGYPLLVLSWLPLGPSRRDRWLGWMLLAPWGVAALAALLVCGAASVFMPEIVPPGEAAVAIPLLLLPLAVVIALLRDRRAGVRLATSTAFR